MSRSSSPRHTVSADSPAPSPARAAALAPAVALLLALAVGRAPAQPAQPAPLAAEAPASAPAVLPVPEPLAADGLDIEQTDRLRGLKKVALAGVAVYVVTEAEGGASAGAAMHGGMSVAHTSLKVTGLEPQRLQALADRAHALAEAALQARGIEVMPLAALQALPSYAALQAVADPAPLAIDAKAGKGMVYSGRGLPLVHMDEMAWLPRGVGGLFGAKVEDPFVALGDKVSAGFRKGRIDPALQGLAAEAGAPLVMVRLVLTAAQVKASGSVFGSIAGTQARNALLLPAWTNRLLVRQPSGDSGRVSLRQARASQAGLGELVDVTTTGAKTVAVLTTALSLAASFYGAGRAVNASNQALELRTSPDHFDAIALPQLEALLTGFAQALTP